MEKSFDCILCGSCVVDIKVRPVPLESAITAGILVPVDPILLTTGGIVSNTGIAMARLGLDVAAFSYVGDDFWADVIRRQYRAEGVHDDGLMVHPEAATSTTAVLIDANGERSFAHNVGAPDLMDKRTFLDNLDVLGRGRMVVIGYYGLMRNLESDLPEVLDAIRSRGCQTAMDAAGDGGTMQPLDRILPHLDVYVPSRLEATNQTGLTDPRKIIATYRDCGAPGLLGVKLGSEGALLSPVAGEFVEIPPVTAPGEIRDTTGAGDSFYAGLLTGLLRGMSIADAGRLAAAAGACCITGLGTGAGINSFEETAQLAGLDGNDGIPQHP